jgi:HlyD family secretion protein
MQKRADWWVKAAKFYKEYAEEELQQLKKMYKANDLTESTETMILRRQQNYVDQANYYYQSAVIEREHAMKFVLPHKEIDLKEAQVKRDLQLTKARKTQGPTLLQKQVSLARMRTDRDKNVARLDRLRKDRAALTIPAPTEGIVYYGKFYKGQWTGAAGLEGKLVPGGGVSPEEVFLTVVQAQPLLVHLTVDEKDVHLVKPGLEGKARVLAQPDRKITARVTRLAPVPASPGKFDAQVALEVGPGDAGLVPGMACKVHFVPYQKKDALAIPSRAIHEEDDKFFVDVVGKKGQTEKREVTPGRTDGEQTEVLSGLRPGDRVVTDGSGSRPARTKTVETEKDKGGVP